ncbi:MAG: YfhO family protein [Paludibacteraceae bacterium]|nr:YfhO family protein [Paludibacteraceae bacterium]
MKEMNSNSWKKLLPYVVALVVFVGLALIYCTPLMDGKVLQAGDVNNWKGAAEEAREYLEETGETTFWTNSMFGGMPTYQITGTTPSGKLRAFLENVAHLGFHGSYAPVGILTAYGIGFFLMLLCFGVNPWISIAGALALSLSSYFCLIIPAGHMTKASALGCLAPMIGGFYAIFRKRYRLGVPLLLIYGIICVTLHPQMTYYTVMLLGVLGIAELYIHIRDKQWKDLGISLGVLTLAVCLIAGTKVSWWQMNNEYLAETMRGGHSELTKNESEDKKVGLDIDYATAWSYGKAETLTLLIPNYMGGASGYDLGKDSQLEKSLKKMGVPSGQARGFCSHAPTYWGEKAFTSGAVYVGAIICFLFVLGLLIVPGPYKWALLIATLFSITLAWGRNMMGWTELFFNYFPMYNKFRAVESILVVAEITMPLLGFLAVMKLSEAGKDERQDKWMQKAILIAGGVTGAVCLFVALFGGGFNVTSSYDAQWKGQVGEQIYEAILDQRHAMMQADAWRSLIFVLLGAALCLWYSRPVKMDKGLGASQPKTLIFAGILAVLILADMVPVDRRFFNNNNFVSQKDDKRYFAEQPWETQILQDKSLDYRVFNLAANTFNDARTSYRLKSIGGYHAAKLRRYQDLIDAHISRNNWNVLNMLNTKYIITRDGQVHLNPDAMGNAWFVDKVSFVETPDDESETLWKIDMRHEAVADKQFADVLAAQTEGSGSIVMTEYKPNKLSYRSTSDAEKVAVFSEIYYPHGWHLYVDDQEVELGRVNYTLRAATIPAGTHQLRMEFVPDAMGIDKLSLAAIILALLLSFGCIVMALIKR